MFHPPKFLSGAPLPPAETRSRSQRAVLLAGVAMLLSYPMFYYEYQRLGVAIFGQTPTPHQLRLITMGNSLLLFFAALLSSLVGFLYAERLSLPGFGRFQDLRWWFPVGIGLGFLLLGPSYLFLDRRLLSSHPELFPAPWPWAVAWGFGNAVCQEVVARFGLLTIAVYLLRWRGFHGHPWPGILAVSLFAVLNSLLFSSRLKINLNLEPAWAITTLVLTFIFQWLYAEVYLRKGLLAAISLHFGLSVKLLVYALMR